MFSYHAQPAAGGAAVGSGIGDGVGAMAVDVAGGLAVAVGSGVASGIGAAVAVDGNSGVGNGDWATGAHATRRSRAATQLANANIVRSLIINS